MGTLLLDGKDYSAAGPIPAIVQFLCNHWLGQKTSMDPILQARHFPMSNTQPSIGDCVLEQGRAKPTKQFKMLPFKLKHSTLLGIRSIDLTGL